MNPARRLLSVGETGGRFVMAALVGLLALGSGSLIWPGLMIQALATLLVALRLGAGPALLTTAIVCVGTAAWFPKWTSGDPRELLNLGLLVVVCVVASWIGGMQHRNRLVLHRQAEQQAALAELGRRALSKEPADGLVRDATALAARALQVEFCHYLELQGDGRTLLLKAGVGWETRLVGKARLELGEGLEPSYVVPTWGPFVLETVDSETHAPPPPWLHEHGARVGMRTVVPSEGPRARGVLGVYTKRGTRTFSAHDVHFLEGMAVLISSVLARAEAMHAVEEQLAVQKALLAGHDALGEGLVLVDCGRPVMANQAFLRLTGRSLEELLALTMEEVLPGVEAVEGAVRHSLVALETASGPVPVEASTTVFREDHQGRCVAMLVRDLRPHLALEKELEEARGRAEREAESLAGVIAALPVAVAVANAAGELVRLNAAARRLWGENMPVAHGVPGYAEYRGWFLPSMEPVRASEWGMALALLERRVVERRHMLIENFDGELRYIANSAAPLLSSTGELLGAVSVNVDETAEVEAQRALETLKKELEDRVRQRTEELTLSNHELETFSYTVAHDLRAPLRAIHGFTNAVLKDFDPDLPATAKAHLQRVCAAATRMDGIIDDLLRLSRVTRSPLARGPTDISRTAREIFDWLVQNEPHRDMQASIEPDLVVDSDPELTRVLLENLLGNAWKFTRDRSPGRIEVFRDAGVREVIVVKDNGIGFDPVFSDRIFLPFERLVQSSLFDGSGIGLSIVRRIIERHGGWIRAKGVPGQGATFRFTLVPGLPPDDEDLPADPDPSRRI